MLDIVDAVRAWYRANARDLPWRRPGTTPYAVLVSEVMLQQTPVARVLEPYAYWLAAWPRPAALAAADAADVIRAWGRLGYPRRALRLREACRAVVADHGGELPADEAALRALPGVGAYTAAAVAAFAFGRRTPVLDTNVRRVLARALDGVELPPATVTRGERERAGTLLPAAAPAAAEWSVAVMELGALVCTARAPRCAACPIDGACAWLAAGRPLADERPRGQAYAGTDRHCRGHLLARLREADAPLPRAALLAAWPEAGQAERCLASLLADGLASPAPGDTVRLGGEPRP